jgi:hypothetical protein
MRMIELSTQAPKLFSIVLNIVGPPSHLHLMLTYPAGLF